MIQIKQAKNSDVRALCGLVEHKDSGYFERCLEEQKEGRRQVFIAQTDKGVGYGVLNWSPQYALYKRLGIPEIQDLNVISVARRQGVATAMIEYCENLVVEAGCEHIGISVALYKDYGPAQRLYAKLGYLPDGNGVTYDREAVSPGEIRPVDDDLCLMMIKAL